jgi:hypothetical protein
MARGVKMASISVINNGAPRGICHRHGGGIALAQQSVWRRNQKEAKKWRQSVK